MYFMCIHVNNRKLCNSVNEAIHWLSHDFSHRRWHIGNSHSVCMDVELWISRAYTFIHIKNILFILFSSSQYYIYNFWIEFVWIFVIETVKEYSSLLQRGRKKRENMNVLCVCCFFHFNIDSILSSNDDNLISCNEIYS